MLLSGIRFRERVAPVAAVIRGNTRKYSAQSALREIENESNNAVDGVVYPPIQDLSYLARFQRVREDWAMAIQKIKTVEEKMIKINMPRYYGWKSVIFNEGNIPYNTLSQIQYLTRTHVFMESGLPSYYKNIVTPEKLKSIVEKMKSSVEDALIFEYNDRTRADELDKETLECPKESENVVSKVVSNEVHRTLMSALSSEYKHLMEADVDYDPRIEAFWFVGGIPPPHYIIYDRKKRRLPEIMHERPVDRGMQYLGTPNFQLRHELPLPEIIPMSESENPTFNVPHCNYDPRATGWTLERRHGTNIPGFWPGDSKRFGLVSYHNCGYMKTRLNTYDDTLDAYKVQAVLGSWGWLLSQACNLGFSTFNDVTYPLTNQMIITNGQTWTFAVYQLNTTLLHSHHIDENPRRNLCWVTEPMQLFEKIENGKIHGLNEEVLENIVKFYANEPREREGVNLQPYLDVRCPVVGKRKGVQGRIWRENFFKHLVSNRPRHRRLPEVYHWQSIYIRKHKTRPMDKKREPWEFGINMWHRRLDDHTPRYIAKCERGEHETCKGQKWEITYYP